MAHGTIMFNGFAILCFHVSIVTPETTEIALVSDVARICTPLNPHVMMPISGIGEL